MKIIVADDELLQLNRLERCVNEAVQGAQVYTFNEPVKLQKWIDEGGSSGVDIAFLDIDMGSMSGIRIAKSLQSMNPEINIIFVTGFVEYAPDAFELRASGYVSKPVTVQKIKAEMENLRYPVSSYGKRISVRCFGNFDVKVNGESIKFKREKSKELLAFLIDRRGAACTPREICAALWEEDKFDYLRQLTKDLRDTLKAADAEDVFVSQFKDYHINPQLIDCDYYDYLADEPYALKAFHGEYMSQYSWAEKTLAGLLYHE